MLRRHRAFSDAADALAPLSMTVREELTLLIATAFDEYTRNWIQGAEGDFGNVLRELAYNLYENHEPFRQAVQNLYDMALQSLPPEEVAGGRVGAVVSEVVAPAIDGGRMTPLNKVRHAFLHILEEALLGLAKGEMTGTRN